MNARRIAAMAIAVALAGLTPTLAAEEDIVVIPDNETALQNLNEQKPETENLMAEMELLAQSAMQASDNLLSELKVYPSF